MSRGELIRGVELLGGGRLVRDGAVHRLEEGGADGGFDGAKRLMGAGEVHHLPRRSLWLGVVSGTAWVSFEGEDYVVGRGEQLALSVGRYAAILSSLGRGPVVYEVREGGVLG